MNGPYVHSIFPRKEKKKLDSCWHEIEPIDPIMSNSPFFLHNMVYCLR